MGQTKVTSKVTRRQTTENNDVKLRLVIESIGLVLVLIHTCAYESPLASVRAHGRAGCPNSTVPGKTGKRSTND